MNLSNLSRKLWLTMAALLCTSASPGWAQSLTTGSSVTVDLRTLLITGRNSSQSETYWDCQTTDSRSTRVPLRLWEDGSGYAGALPVEWSLTNGQSLLMKALGSDFHLADIQPVLNTDVDIIQDFSARDVNTGDRYQCHRLGPDPLNGAPLLDDPQDPLVQALAGNSMRNWYCVETQSDASVVAVSYRFDAGGGAMIDAAPARWFVDDDFNIVTTSSSGVQSLSDVSLTNDDQGFGTLDATRAGVPLHCTQAPG